MRFAKGTWGAVLLVLLLGAFAVGLAQCVSGPAPQIEERYLGTAVISGRPMLYTNQHSNLTPPPRPTDFPYYGGNLPRGQECLMYLKSQMPTASTFDWSEVDTCIANAAGRTVTLGTGEVISQPVMLVLPAEYLQMLTAAPAPTPAPGTVNNPFGDMYALAPSWMTGDSTYAVKFQNPSTGAYYWGVKYHNLKTIYQNLFNAAAARYDSNPQVGLIRVNLGMEYETQPTKSGEGGGQSTNVLLAYHAAASSCDQYRDFIKSVSEYADNAFTKPVAIVASTSPCYTTKAIDPASMRKDLFAAWRGIRPIGSSLALLAPDRGDAEEPTGNALRDYKAFTTGNTVAVFNDGPVSFEFGLSTTGVTTEDKYQYWYWSIIAGLAAGADYIEYNYTWDVYQNAFGWELADKWLTSEDSGIVVLRGAEWPAYDYMGSASYGASGYTDNANRWLAVATPTVHPQACSVALATAAATRNNVTPTPQIYACKGTVLPTPKATLQSTPVYEPIYGATPPVTNMLQRVADRQARVLLGNQQMAIRVQDTAWPKYQGTYTNAKLLQQFLDVGSGCETWTWPTSASTTASQQVCNGNSGLWKRREVTAATLYIDNVVSTNQGSALLKIQNDSADSHYVQMVQVNPVNAASTPTNTPSPTPTSTPTATSTPSPTPTSSPTPVFGLMLNELCPNPNADMNLDGSGPNPRDRALELYNSQASRVDLAGYKLVWSTPLTYTFPSSSYVQPYGYKMLYGDELGLNMPPAGTVALKNAAGAILDTVTYIAQTAGMCYARKPTASTNWVNNSSETLGRAN